MSPTTNARTLDLPLQVVHDRVQRWLDGGADDVFDLVLLDPPYDVPESTLSAVLDRLVARVAEDGVVVVERSSRSPEPRWPDGLAPLEPRTYGETRVWFAERVA